MKRFLSSLRHDAVVQFRAGFYFVGAAVAAFYVGLLASIPESWPLDLPLLVPAALLINVLITTFYFVAALVLLERSEGMLAVLAVSPLRPGEYIAAKVVTLAVLAMGENVAVLLFFYGFAFEPLPLAVGLTLLCGFYTLLGIAVIARFDSINRFLIPSVFVVTLLLLPLLSHFGAVAASLMYLHPVQPFLTLVTAAFLPASALELVYAVVASLVWLSLAYGAARRAYRRLAPA